VPLIISRDIGRISGLAEVHIVPIKLEGSIGGHVSLGAEAQDNEAKLKVMAIPTTTNTLNKNLVFIFPPDKKYFFSDSSLKTEVSNDVLYGIYIQNNTVSNLK
jgi:hypothetical protein